MALFLHQSKKSLEFLTGAKMVYKDVTIIGGSLHDIARQHNSYQATSARVREMLGSSSQDNNFSKLMQGQISNPDNIVMSQSMDAMHTKALASLARLMEGGAGSPVQNALTNQSISDMIGALNRKSSSTDNSKKPLSVPLELNNKKELLEKKNIDSQNSDTEKLGQLSAKFESGKNGIEAIGYDRVGGTSYGKYQIASRPGTMDGFIEFLKEEAPDIAEKLENAGPANTGSRKGKMPEVWKEIAQNEPERFTKLQEDFIKATHYTPALENIRSAGINVDEFSPALKEVLWSTSVQHGASAASRIFVSSAEDVGYGDKGSEQDMIKSVYADRATKFGSSTAQVQQAVRNRFAEEQSLALAMV